MKQYLIKFTLIVEAKNKTEADKVGEAINNCVLPTFIEDKIEFMERTSPEEIPNE